MTKGRILIVDDDEVVTGMLSEMLTTEAYVVKTCTRGDEVIPVCEQFRPSAVLLDIFIGTTNGLTLLQEIKELSWPTAVIMMTGLAEVSVAVESMKKGAFDFISKPFEGDHLIALLERLSNTSE